MKKAIVIAVAAATAIAAIIHFSNTTGYKSTAPSADMQTVPVVFEPSAASPVIIVTGGRSDSGVSLTDITFDKYTFIADIQNNSGGFINFGNEYTLERLEGQGYKAQEKNSACEFTAGGNVIDSGFSTDQVYDRSAYPSELVPGTYRFTATVYTSLDEDEKNALHPSIVFEITETQ